MVTSVLVRLNDEQKELIDMAAEKSGKKVSTWMREVLLGAAVDVLADTVEKQTTYSPGEEVIVEPVGGVVEGKVRAFDPKGPEVVVEMLPGVKGKKAVEVKFDAKKGEVTQVPVGDRKYTGVTGKDARGTWWEVETEKGKRTTYVGPKG